MAWDDDVPLSNQQVVMMWLDDVISVDVVVSLHPIVSVVDDRTLLLQHLMTSLVEITWHVHAMLLVSVVAPFPFFDFLLIGLLFS